MPKSVNFFDKLRLEAKFDDFTVIADQPIRYRAMARRRGRSITSWPRRPCVRPTS